MSVHHASLTSCNEKRTTHIRYVLSYVEKKDKIFIFQSDELMSGPCLVHTNVLAKYLKERATISDARCVNLRCFSEYKTFSYKGRLVY